MDLLIESSDDFTEGVHARVCSAGTRARFERGGIAPAHHAREHSHFEKRDELLLGVDLLLRRSGGLGTPSGAQHAVAGKR